MGAPRAPGSGNVKYPLFPFKKGIKLSDAINDLISCYLTTATEGKMYIKINVLNYPLFPHYISANILNTEITDTTMTRSKLMETPRELVGRLSIQYTILLKIRRDRNQDPV